MNKEFICAQIRVNLDKLGEKDIPTIKKLMRRNKEELLSILNATYVLLLIKNELENKEI